VKRARGRRGEEVEEEGGSLGSPYVQLDGGRAKLLCSCEGREQCHLVARAGLSIRYSGVVCTIFVIVISQITGVILQLQYKVFCNML